MKKLFIGLILCLAWGSLAHAGGPAPSVQTPYTLAFVIHMRGGKFYADPPPSAPNPSNASQALVSAWTAANNAGYGGALEIYALGSPTQTYTTGLPSNGDQAVSCASTLGAWCTANTAGYGGALAVYCVNGCSGGGGSPGGSNTQVQFNNSSSFGGSANLTWVSPTLTIGASGTAGSLTEYNNTATTTWASGATTSNTIKGFTVAPTSTDLVSVTTVGTVATLTDTGMTASGGTLTATTFAGALSGGTVSATTGTFSSTLGVTGLLTASGGLAVAGSGAGLAGLNCGTANAVTATYVGFQAPASCAAGLLFTLPSTAASAGALLAGAAASGVSTISVGTVPITSGGTGQTTAGAAFNALAPATSKGGLIVGSGSNTYGNVAVGTTGQCLVVASGTWGAGTCGTTASATALTFTDPVTINLGASPSSGQYLEYNGSAIVGATPSGGGSPGGSNTQVQYNNSSSFGGIADITSDGTNLTVATGGKLVNSGTIDNSGAGVVLNGAPWNGGSSVFYQGLSDPVCGATVTNSPWAACTGSGATTVYMASYLTLAATTAGHINGTHQALEFTFGSSFYATTSNNITVNIVACSAAPPTCTGAKVLATTGSVNTGGTGNPAPAGPHICQLWSTSTAQTVYLECSRGVGLNFNGASPITASVPNTSTWYIAFQVVLSTNTGNWYTLDFGSSRWIN